MTRPPRGQEGPRQRRRRRLGLDPGPRAYGRPLALAALLAALLAAAAYVAAGPGP